MLINITKFLIISQSQFELIITQFNCNLTINDPNYLITYLFANLLAYILIYIILKIVLVLYFKLFKRS